MGEVSRRRSTAQSHPARATYNVSLTSVATSFAGAGAAAAAGAAALALALDLFFPPFLGMVVYLAGGVVVSDMRYKIENEKSQGCQSSRHVLTIFILRRASEVGWTGRKGRSQTREERGRITYWIKPGVASEGDAKKGRIGACRTRTGESKGEEEEEERKSERKKGMDCLVSVSGKVVPGGGGLCTITESTM